MHCISTPRSLAAFLSLLVSALVYSNWKYGSIQRLHSRPSSIETAPLFNSSSSRKIALPFNSYDFLLNYSYSNSPHTVNKRARTLDWTTAVCKGEKLYQRILAAFEGSVAPGPQFSEQDIDNGWVGLDDPVKGGLDSGWDDPFKQIGGKGREPTKSESIAIDLRQWKPFKNKDGEMVTDIDRTVRYEVAYIPSYSALVVLNAWSPANQVKEDNEGISEADVLKRVPPLNRLSDVIWVVWNTVSKSPNDLRYIGRDNIINEDSKGIMKDIFDKGEAKGPVKWPGLTFGLDTQEGQALLATPNGVATAWLLIDRARQLGRRIPMVTIFSPFPNTGGYYRMLWDLRPLTPTSSLKSVSTSRPVSTTKPVATSKSVLAS
ncbi:MAG: hypothetical protein Q9225_005425 [Loekoesia sp. 1 TL-2023]